jgi:hypothetical protein
VGSERNYPGQLAARVVESWPADASPLPRRLAALLDTAYHASFLRDEERPVMCRILVLPRAQLADDSGPPWGLLPLLFTRPRAFDEHELRRLSPAAKVQRALIGVEDTHDDFITWGLIQSGPRWLQAAQGGRAKEPPMPRAAVIRVVRPGHLIVGCGSRHIAELRGGRLSDFRLDVFQSEWLPALFKSQRDAVAAAYAASSSLPSEDAANTAANLSKHVSQQMIKRVVATMRATHHGGTLIVGPPDCVAERFLHTKYAFSDGPARKRFRALVVRILHTLAERAAEVGRLPDTDLYRFDTDPRLAELDEALFETSHLIAALADVDGAVVLTKGFEILGFGAEIAGDLPRVSEVRRALDLEGEAFTTEFVEGVGTRHRSAYRLCAAVPGAVAIVVSQDGGVRFITQHRGAVTYWDHGPGDG